MTEVTWAYTWYVYRGISYKLINNGIVAYAASVASFPLSWSDLVQENTSTTRRAAARIVSNTKYMIGCSGSQAASSSSSSELELELLLL